MTSVRNDAPGLQPELIVVAHPEAQLRLHGTRVRSAAASPAPLEQALVETGAHARPLFGPSEERIRAELGESPWDLPDLSLYYNVTVEADHEAVAARLNEEESVAGAYVKAPVRIDEGPLPASVSADAPTDAVSPDFGSRQGHLDAAPGGVSARTAWGQPGGDGTGVQVVVVGGAWRLTHEDLAGNVGGIIGGQPIDALSFRNHGTAMLGLVRATRNDRGVTGVAPACQVRQVATFGLGTAARHPPGRGRAGRRRRPPDRVAAAGAWLDRGRIGRLPAPGVVARRLRGHRLRHSQGRDRRRAGGQRVGLAG